MILIKYKLDKSAHHGIGLFTDENLAKGQIVYVASLLLDTNISEEIFDSLDEREKSEIKYWGFKIEEDNVWHVDFDVSKFINHSFSPTVAQDPKHKDAYLITTGRTDQQRLDQGPAVAALALRKAGKRCVSTRCRSHELRVYQALYLSTLYDFP